MQTLDGDLEAIPNSQLNEGPIINRFDPVTDRRMNTKVGVAYDTDPDRVKEVLFEAVELISKRHEPEIHLRSFGDSALTFEVFVWIESEEDRRESEDELNTAIYRALDEAEIKIPFPQREVAVEHDSDTQAG